MESSTMEDSQQEQEQEEQQEQEQEEQQEQEQERQERRPPSRAENAPAAAAPAARAESSVADASAPFTPSKETPLGNSDRRAVRLSMTGTVEDPVDVRRSTATASSATEPSTAERASHGSNRRRIRIRRNNNNNNNSVSKAPRACASSVQETRLAPPAHYRTPPSVARAPVQRESSGPRDSVLQKIRAYTPSSSNSGDHPSTDINDNRSRDNDKALLHMDGVTPGAATTVQRASSPSSSLGNYLDQHKNRPRREDDFRPPKAEHDYTEESVSDLGDSVDLMDAPDHPHPPSTAPPATITATATAPAAPAYNEQPGAVRISNQTTSPRPRGFLSRMLTSESVKTSDDNLSNADGQQGLVAATAVARDDIEQQVRNEFLHNAVTATRVETVTVDEDQQPKPMSGTPDTYQSNTDSSDRNSDFCCCRSWCACGITLIVTTAACGCILLTGIAIGAVFAIMASLADELEDELNSTNEKTVMPSVSLVPTVSPTHSELDSDAFTKEVLRSLLVANSPNPNALSDPSTPQYAAFEWLADYVYTVYDRQTQAGETQTIFDDPDLFEKLIERYALASLYYASDGPNWNRNDNWLSEETVCQWFPALPNQCVEVNGFNRIRRLSLLQNGLAGELVPELSMLFELQVLGLDNARLDTPTYQPPEQSRALQTETNNTDPSNRPAIPPSFGSMEQLQELTLRRCQLKGTIPPQIGDMSSLRKLDLSKNSMGGKIPSQIGNLKLLTTVNLSENKFTGNLPISLGRLSNIESFVISDNLLMGRIPQSLGQWTSIQFMRLEGNDFTGGSIEEVICSNGNQDGVSLGDTMTDLAVDCQEIACSCCTECCVDAAECNENVRLVP